MEQNYNINSTGLRKNKKNRYKRVRIILIAESIIIVILGIAIASIIITYTNTKIKATSKIEATSKIPEILKTGTIAPDTNKDTENDYKVKNIFQDYYYYESDKEQRYITYKQQNTQISDSDIVWMVNAGLDKPYYTDIKEITNTSEFPLVVNKYNKLSDSFKPENLEKLPSGKLATHDTKEAFEKMSKDAKSQKLNLIAVSAYRSIEYQKNLYNTYLKNDSQETVDTYSARAGFSEHHTGRAIDLGDSSANIVNFENTKESIWINENAYKYGFIVRYKKNTTHITGYKYEPWHITYVGTEIAKSMHDNNIETLEEYKVKYIDHQPKNK